MFALFDCIHRHFGQLDIVVNNADIARLKSFLEQAEQEWQQELDINLTAVWRCLRHEIRMMPGQIYGGAIINMPSAAGLSAVCPGIFSHVAAKHGGIGLNTVMFLASDQSSSCVAGRWWFHNLLVRNCSCHL